MASVNFISCSVFVSFNNPLVSSVASIEWERVSLGSAGVFVGVTGDGSLVVDVFLAWALVIAVTALVCGVSMLIVNVERIEFISFRETSVFDYRNSECGFEFNALHMLAIICPLDAAAPSKNACERSDWSNLLCVELSNLFATGLLERFL